MYLNGSGATAAYLGYAKVWPTGSSETYTFVDSIWADSNANPGNLDLGHFFKLTSTVRLKATARQYSGGLWIGGDGDARFFATSASAAYFDLGGSSGANRIMINARQYGVKSGDTFDVYLNNFSIYNATIGSGYTGTTVTRAPVERYIRVKLSHLYVYEVDIWDNGVQVGNYLPAKRDSDGLYGLYDTITDMFYTSTDFTIYGGTPT